MTSKFGYILKHYDYDLSNNPELLENRSRNLEEIGFESIWITDHILLPKGSRLPKYEKITEILTTVAYLAGKTDKIKFGLSTLVLPARDTILAAKQLSSLHYFLGDRFMISFGAGWAETEFDVLQKDFKNRGARMNEQIQVIRSLFRGEPGFSGDFHNYDNVELLPRREGLETLPVYISGNSKSAIERYLQFGDGWHPNSVSPEDFRQVFEDYPKIDPTDVIIRLKIGDEDIAQTVEQYEKLGIQYFVFDDGGDLGKFERIIQYVRSFQEFQP